MDLPGSDLVNGENVLAVEVHQCNASSGDIIFGATLKALTVSSLGADVVLNEIMADNPGALGTDGNTADWIELYNTADQTISLAGWTLTDDVLKPTRFTLPTNSVIAARGFLTVWCDDATHASGLHTGFGLDVNGQTVVLMAPATNGYSVKDTVVFGLQIPNASMGRVADGTGAWQLTVPTFGNRNQSQPTTNSTPLKINEWMASPVSGDAWFELFNPQPLPAPLGGCYLSDSATAPATAPITPLSFIAAHGFAHFSADKHPEKGANHVAFKISASGDTLALFTSNSVPKLIDSVSFSAQPAGVSQGRLPDGQTPIVSFPTTPTPGAPNYLPLTNVLINEVLSHSDPPYDDAIELFNPTVTAIPIGGWYLSDSHVQPKKFRIPDGVTLAPGGYAAFYESQFNADTNAPTRFALSSSEGDAVVLSAVDENGNLTGYRAYLPFGPAESDISFGRVVTSMGDDYAPLLRPTLGVETPATLDEFHRGTGASNSPPLVGPAVISEIMYRPADRLEGTNRVDNTDDEFLEILNVQAVDLPLFHVNQPTNTWHLRGAVDFDFPTNLVLAPSGVVVVVGFDPATNGAALAAFKQKYSAPATARIVGPWRGKLGNRRETIRLLKPLAPVMSTNGIPGQAPYALVEQIQYASETPWLVEANGSGWSLQRVRSSAYGNDPVHWMAAQASPGELEAAPRLEAIRMEHGLVTFQFMAHAERVYQIEFCDDLWLGNWQLIEPFTPGQTDRTVIVTNAPPIETRARFYRLQIR